jgi:hypothetical protein
LLDLLAFTLLTGPFASHLVGERRDDWNKPSPLFVPVRRHDVAYAKLGDLAVANPANTYTAAVCTDIGIFYLPVAAGI